ncbi:uncharacterized protein BCR38DRAFT_477485 [Pseudomassariella vexata]|uniref:Serine/threonine-protein kinase Tel1 n=1 Tax=Pseudomassariella vexata TaxID=1141098 RepID=A0A1Y2DJ14_9PEZI|nr:uncharacterized protein BCR38DRAFT_477485 [Pseudomassariella vexata]ORY59219.1 hypothetical protein BCR38DRAFT_477485 [Pseudomassariella vexata]
MCYVGFFMHPYDTSSLDADISTVSLKGGSQTARSNALDDLLFLFGKKSRASELSKIKDKEYHSLLDAVFHCTLAEKSVYLSKTKCGTKTSEDRLAKCGKALQSVIENGAQKFKRKTLLAVVDHIIETLPGPDDDLISPLLQNYIKALVVLVSQPARVELLATYNAESWLSCVDFTVKTITQYIENGDRDSGPSRASPAPGTTQAFSNALSTLRSSSNSSLSRGGGQKQKQSTRLQDLFQCLLSLVSAANAPLLQRSKDISSVVTQALQLRSLNKESIPLGFAILHVILAFAQTDDSDHANFLTRELLPLISYWWPDRKGGQDNALINSIQTEILKTLLSIHLGLECLVRCGESSILADIEDLCELLWTEYSRREDRAQLQQDDLTYSRVPRHSHSFHTHLFGLRPNNVEAERKWAFIQVLALLEGVLWKESRPQTTPVDADDEQPRKKRRTTEGASRLRQKLRSIDHSVQFTAMQIIPFFISNITLTAPDMAETLSLLIGLTGHKDGKLVTWALIASASLAQSGLATHDSLVSAWKQLWYIAARNVSISGNCRASCILLHSIVSNDLLPYRDISDDVNSVVTAADISGPAIAVDASIILMTTLLQLRNYQLPSASYATGNHIVRWLSLRWDPADITFISFHSAHVDPLEIINLFRVSCGIPLFIPSGFPQAICGPICESWSFLQERADIVRYLLLLEDRENAPSIRRRPQDSNAKSIMQVTETSDSRATRKLVAELLHPKLEEVGILCESWSKRGDGSSQISTKKLQSLMCCLITVAFTVPHLTEVNSTQSQNLEPILFEVLKDGLRAIPEAPESQSLYESILESVRPYLPACSTAPLERFLKDLPQLARLFSEISVEYREDRTKQPFRGGDDIMDVDDDGFGSQQSRSGIVSRSFEISRRQCSMFDSNSFYSDTGQRLQLLGVLCQDPGQVGLVPPIFLDSFLASSDEMFLSCRSLIQELIAGDLVISSDDASRVVEKLGGIIGASAFSSCEVALTTCINTIQGLKMLWQDERSDLLAIVGELYHFFITKAFPSNILSPKVQTALSRLLLGLTEVNEKFMEGLKLPTTVETLFNLLEQGTISVKFFIGAKLPNIFKRYILKMHDKVFVNILNSLPTDAGNLEGIALRLFVLGELAQQWPTLLRRCIYHIFETPGNVRESTKHAAYCLRKVATKLGLDSPQRLFDLFAPQLLYTWLDEESIESIAYEIFGFSDLEELLKRAQAEAAALMTMRGQDSTVAELAESLHQSPTQLIRTSFSKVFAYSIAHDISMPKSQQSQAGETRIRKMLGREPFLESVYINFADIIATFFTMVDQDDPIERSWTKEDNLAYAAEILDEIKKCGHSEVELPANQQPSFRAKYLTRQMALLCGRTEYEMPNIWTPALVVTVARKLFNMIHPALGALHACSVIRKVRLLICLAGPLAWDSYPLEMLLHCLRPWVVDSECADDALGMTQYLLEHGSESLSQSPSFLAGYALSTLASLRVFLESSQASTTQESQYKATMTKAQKFHSWLTKYLEAYQSPLLQDEQQLSAFKAITHSAARVRSSGNAERGTHESNLLLEILRDEGSDQPLLNDPSRRLALEMLCTDFRLPASFRADAVNSDEAALELATPLWKSSHARANNEQYLVWTGRVIGRSFAASGDIDQTLLQESHLPTQYQEISDEHSSEQGLLGLMQSLTAASDGVHAGLAESALRTIVSEAAAQEDNDLLAACQKVLTPQLRVASDWSLYRPPPSDNVPVESVSLSLTFASEAIESPQWCQHLTIHLTQSVPESIVLSALPQILSSVKGFAEQAFPFIIHLVLLFEHDAHQSAKKKLSAVLNDWLGLASPEAKDNVSLLLNALLYLRTRCLPGETSIADRSQWLDLDLSVAASAATRCGMFKTALLFVESAESEGSGSSRRSSTVRAQESTDVLLDIFENIDDPDAYYGLHTNASLRNVLARLEYEKDSHKSLAFRGAQYDSHVRRRDPASNADSQSLVGTLNSLGLSGLSHSLQTQQTVDGAYASVDHTFVNARRLEIWNLPVPASTIDPSVTLYKAYQGCHQANTLEDARSAIHNGLSRAMQNLVKRDISTASIRQNMGTLAALTELDDVLNISNSAELDNMLTTFEERSKWMKRGRYADVRHILSCRETTLSILGHNLQVRAMGDVNQPNTRLVEVKSMLLSSTVYRFHQATQESLNIATALNDLISPSYKLGLNIDAAAKLEAANSLWDHGEMSSSIRMLQSIDDDSDLKNQTIPVRRSDLLAKIGYQVSVARLEKPDSIQKNYLQPALKELGGKSDGQEAGKVYHQFAMFCDEQLQNPDGLEDLARLQHLRQGKSDEVTQLKGLISSTRDSQTKGRYQNHLAKAKQWLDLDEQELRRVEQSRSEFVRLSLENYLLSLSVSNEHNNDALRFAALWLERSGEDFLNEAVKKYIDKVPTRKFAPLMNQLTSRLLDQASLFQRVLIDLVYRICVDHPYHGMYQIWSGTRSRMNKDDDVAVLRQKATTEVSKKLQQNEAVSKIWLSIDRTSKAYHTLAVDRDSRYKAGQKIAIKDSGAGVALINSLAKYRIPPPTLQMELSANRDYSRVPYVIKIEPNMTIASGVSAPKIITLVGNNGERFKQLVKGGNDDLRQDAIMEQVFLAVSSVLKLHRSTQQRNLGIRTYKVLPLTASSGIIEFVPNTIPLHEYLMPAHERYHPKDLKGNNCRKEISNVQNKSVETRLATFKKVTDRFKPVMRYFFTEYFVDPDEWYTKRTAYTRTTAAISILGHVLGLGDRHGHNILLDSHTGEVVHIDLGVAFEMGRVLPVPELVPFRLTRDIIDGMGITRTEGVFRRCCEFTLDALREETYSIMTILDVLRYDPLYSWSMSPVRMARLQDTRQNDEPGAGGPTESELDPRRKRGTGNGGSVVNEPSEADRALEVVRKKLSKTLSVTATVNDLINQATDERNLAVLYSGWAAYA